jgi:hypothetical protein
VVLIPRYTFSLSDASKAGRSTQNPNIIPYTDDVTAIRQLKYYSLLNEVFLEAAIGGLVTELYASSY